MTKENLMDALGDIARDKGIPKERLIEVVQEAVATAAKRKYKQYEEIEARINTESGELEVFRYKTVTDNLTDPENQVPLEDARKLDSLAEPGDEVEYEIDNQELSRVIAQTARQMIFQKIREAERETIFENFKDRIGEVLNGVVSRTERNRTFITFNQTEAILYRREQIPNERYGPGDHIRCILLDVLNDPKEPSQLVISRADPNLLGKLFEMEVPEIYDGIVEIVTAAREPGRRAKIAVRSNDTDVDPVGACVGMRGARVQSIISELRGEKIDIISWTDDLPSYVANALAPAELTRIRINEEAREIDVEVESDQLSLAIGKQGQNVRLASKLLDYKINISGTQDQTLSLEEQIRERLLASQAELTAGTPGGAPAEATLEPVAGAESAVPAEEPAVVAAPETAEAATVDAAPPEEAATPVAEPAVEAAPPETVAEAAPEPAETAPAPAEEPIVEAAQAEAAPETVAEAAPEPAETAPETVAEPAETAPALAEEPVAEAAPEAVAEAAVVDVAEPAVEAAPAEEATEVPTAESQASEEEVETV